VIGNDVIDIDLAKTESNWKRKGFLDKIFTFSEQLQIHHAENHELMVWSLWSRKEAAYKIFNRETTIRLYNPLQFECSEMKFSEGIYSGSVTNKGIVYFTKTEITPNSIHTIAVSDKNDFSKIYELKDRSALTKRDGIPETDTKKPVSISHHGRFERIVSL